MLISQKFRAILVAAVRAGGTALVMCDAGCGVYMNKPDVVGRIFGELVKTEFAHAFKEIHMAAGAQFNEAAMTRTLPLTESSVSSRVLNAFRFFDENENGRIIRLELFYVFNML